MKDLELLRRRGLISQYKSLSFPEWFFSSLSQMLEIKTQVGVSEHVLGKVKVAFGLLHSAMSLMAQGSKVLLLMHYLLGVAMKRENWPFGVSYLYSC